MNEFSKTLKRVLVPIADGSEEIEAVGIIDTLRRAGADVTVAAVSKLQITASRGTRIIADTLLDHCRDREYDLIVLPGGMPGALKLRDSEILAELLKKQVAEGRYYAAICAAPAVVLAYHGLIGNRMATAYPSLVSQLPHQQMVERRVVVDGKCITGKGPGAALEFALVLVGLLFGRDIQDRLSREMLVILPWHEFYIEPASSPQKEG